MTEAQTTEDEAEGRAAVRHRLIHRLRDAGMVRPKGVAEAAHDAMLARLVDHLAYMSPAVLDVLADEVMAVASGAKRNEWPSEVTVRNMAQALQPRPFAQAPIVSSWLASVEGPMAEAGGYLVELFRFLRERRRPVLPHDLRQIKEQAGENARMRRVIEERRDCGRMSPDDGRWIEAYLTDAREAQAIVDAGRARRNNKQAGAA